MSKRNKAIDIIIIGGGLGGLMLANLLVRKNYKVLLIEKKRYPFHRVCGEYISLEVAPLLRQLGMYPESVSPAQISHLYWYANDGTRADLELPLGGMGISRYYLDQFWVEKNKEMGVEILEGTEVLAAYRQDDHFEVQLKDGDTLQSRMVVGAFGKRSRMDKFMSRPFIQGSSPWVGVKYHIQYDFPQDVVALMNFEGGYCGLNKVEKDLYNLCYLVRKEQLEKHKNIVALEASVLQKNPVLAEIWTNANFLLEKPMVINEVSFAKKNPVEQGMMMVGDSAGLITPMCGNGMAMAIHSAYLAALCLDQHWDKTDANFHTSVLKDYEKQWNTTFRQRLRTGRWVQKIFTGKLGSQVARKIFLSSPAFARRIIKQTHGKPWGK